MYGTIARMRVKPGKEAELMAMQNEQGGRAVAGYAGYIVYRTDADPQVYYLVVLFQSKEAYFANAHSPEQHQEYLRFRSLLDADPEWNDGEVVDMQLAAAGGA